MSSRWVGGKGGAVGELKRGYMVVALASWETRLARREVALVVGSG